MFQLTYHGVDRSFALQIGLVAHEHHDHIGIGILFDLFSPFANIPERLVIADIVDQERSC